MDMSSACSGKGAHLAYSFIALGALSVAIFWLVLYLKGNSSGSYWVGLPHGLLLPCLAPLSCVDLYGALCVAFDALRFGLIALRRFHLPTSVGAILGYGARVAPGASLAAGLLLIGPWT